MASRAATPAGRRGAAARKGANGRAPATESANARAGATKPRKRARAVAPKRPSGKGTAASRKGERATPRRRSPASVRSARRPRHASARRRRPLAGWSLPRLRLPSLAWRQAVLLVLGVGAALAAGYFLYLRDSSLVAVTKVEVKGVRSGDRERIVAALEAAGREMTTLHVRTGELEGAVAAFPTVESVSADASFPHGLTIEVSERPPALVAQAGGREMPIAADGTLLAGVKAADELDLPVLELGELPQSGKLTGEPLEQALVAGAVPDGLRPLIEAISYSNEYGVVMTMKGGIPIRFGTGARAEAKWAAAAAVLADPKLQSLGYVDVRVPERPAAGAAAIASTTG
jgi:cell division protein FtsQ